MQHAQTTITPPLAVRIRPDLSFAYGKGSPYNGQASLFGAGAPLLGSPDVLPFLPIDDIAVTMIAAEFYTRYMERKYGAHLQ